MLLKLKKHFFAVGLIILMITPRVKAQTAGSYEVKALSFNLWRKNQGWSTRFPNIINLINSESADVVGLQEGDEGKQADVANALTDYTLETGPWNDGSSGLLYNINTLEVVEAGNFGYSSQPDNKNVRDWGDGAIHGWLRTCNWVRFRHKSTGEQFYAYNTHLDANGFSSDPGYWRSQEVRLLAQRIKDRTHPEYPFMVIGDLNGTESEEAIHYLKSGADNPIKMVDTYREALPDGPGDSFGSVKYDYIMVADASEIRTKSANIIYHSSYGWTSDHNQVVAVVEFNTSTPQPDAAAIKALSFNVRVGVDGGNKAWNSRRQDCINLVIAQAPDFMGIQEALPGQKTDLDYGLSDYWQFGRGREADGSGEGSQIFYKQSRWELAGSENGTFQLSPTPEAWGSNGWGFQYKRVCTWGRFRDKTTGKHVYIFNTHYPLSASGRTNCSNLIASRIASRAHTEDPVILMGDLNADEGEYSVQILKGMHGSPISMTDTWRVIHPTEQNKGTFSGWSSQPNPSAKIDYVFAMGYTTVEAAEIVYQPSGVIISDHFPIYGTISLNEASPTPPVISTISHTPGAPLSTNEVTVSGTVTDDNTVQSVQLLWGYSSGNLSNTVSMNAAGATYSGIIPAQGDGTTVYYQLKATDNDNLSAWSEVRSYNVSDNPQILFADYDVVDLEFTGFEGSTFAEINNPFSEGINTSGRVATTTQGFASWSGIVASNLTNAVDFTNTPILKMKVHGPKVGSLLVKFEDENDNSVFSEVSVELTKINEWTEVEFDFTGVPSNTYEKMVLFFDFGNDAQDVYYFDDIRLEREFSAKDCHGEVNGSASIDDCDVCSGGSTGIDPNSSCKDCHGEVNGSASIDDCNVCSGGSTGIDPNSSCKDCHGEVNGSASMDDCNVCSGGSTGIDPNASCKDCHGEVNGSALVDACGICSGGNTGVDPSSPTIWYADTDGDGTGDENVSVESCNQPTNYVSVAGDFCPQDVNKTVPGDCGCNVAEGSCTNIVPSVSITSPESSVIYVSGVDLPVTISANDPDGTIVNYIVLVNNLEVYNRATYNGYTLQNTSKGSYNLKVIVEDNDGAVSEITVTIQVDDKDCHGDLGGAASIDECDVCSGGTTGVAPNSSCTDCNNEVNGSAAIDDCNVCSGGSTGIEKNASCKDCHGDVNGSAALDVCNECAGGNTNRVPVTDLNNCLTGFDKEQTKLFTLYPNPFFDQLHIEGTETGSLKVRDMLGRLIYQQEINGVTAVSTIEWQTGLYLITVTGEGYSVSQQLVKH